MRIKVLGGFGSEQPCCNLTGFLLNGCVMLDAGTISTGLTIAEMTAITHVVLSHAHLDHTNALPFLADNVVGKKDSPVIVAAVDEVISAVSSHLFNNSIWPDFTKIPSEDNPVIKYHKLAAGREEKLGGGLEFKPVMVNHAVPTTGFIIKDGDKAIVYSGDTKATDEIWDVAAGLGNNLKAVLVETSFPNCMQEMADKSCHLTPQTLGKELDKIKGYDGSVFVYHVKCQYISEIEREIKALGREGITIVSDGMELEV